MRVMSEVPQVPQVPEVPKKKYHKYQKYLLPYVMVIYKNVTKGEGGVILTINYNVLIYNAVQCLFEIKNILLYLLLFKIIYISLFKFI
jgi:hypothetical protein